MAGSIDPPKPSLLLTRQSGQGAGLAPPLRPSQTDLAVSELEPELLCFGGFVCSVLGDFLLFSLERWDTAELRLIVERGKLVKIL